MRALTNGHFETFDLNTEIPGNRPFEVGHPKICAQQALAAAKFIANPKPDRARLIHRDGFGEIIIIGERLGVCIAQIFAIRLHAPAVFRDAERPLEGREGREVIHGGVALSVGRRGGGIRERMRLTHRTDLEKQAAAAEINLVAGADVALKARRASERNAERSAEVSDLVSVRLLERTEIDRGPVGPVVRPLLDQSSLIPSGTGVDREPTRDVQSDRCFDATHLLGPPIDHRTGPAELAACGGHLSVRPVFLVQGSIPLQTPGSPIRAPADFGVGEVVRRIGQRERPTSTNAWVGGSTTMLLRQKTFA